MRVDGEARRREAAMRVAVVGATGLIGGVVSAALVARGDEVVALTRGTREIPGARGIPWDGATPVPDGALDGVDAVVNLAGAPIARRWSDAVKREVVESRVDVTRRLVAAIGSGGPGVLVNASAVGFYGGGEREVDESAGKGSGFLADVCADWERAAMEAASAGVRVVLLRTGIVLSRDGGALAQMLGPAKLGLGGPIAGGRQWFPWVHVDDLVGIVLLALDDPALRGPVNVVAPGIVRQGDFSRALGRATGRPAVMPVPAFAMRAMFGEGAQVVLDGQHATPRAALAAGYAFRHPDLDGALAALV
jgi:hypothetical protein